MWKKHCIRWAPCALVAAGVYLGAARSDSPDAGWRRLAGLPAAQQARTVTNYVPAMMAPIALPGLPRSSAVAADAALPPEEKGPKVARGTPVPDTTPIHPIAIQMGRRDTSELLTGEEAAAGSGRGSSGRIPSLGGRASWGWLAEDVWAAEPRQASMPGRAQVRPDEQDDWNEGVWGTPSAFDLPRTRSFPGLSPLPSGAGDEGGSVPGSGRPGGRAGSVLSWPGYGDLKTPAP